MTVSSAQRSQKGKHTKLPDDADKKSQVKRVRDVEITVPICVGTIAFYLGKKSDEFHSHKWTAYLRAHNNESLSGVVKKVVFQLHASFQNPTRVVEEPPFELTETGWGEFELGINVYFHPDAAEKPVELLHHLKLYAEEDQTAPQSTKKPVVTETYDEIVFPEPAEVFFNRIHSHPVLTLATLSGGPLPPMPVALQAEGEAAEDWEKGSTKDHPLVQYFPMHEDSDELARIAVARQQVRASVEKLERELAALDAEAERIRAGAG